MYVCTSYLCPLPLCCVVADMSKTIFKERSEKINKRLELVNRRYEALEKRRNLEVQGYKADIKLQREKLKDLEKRLCKVKYECNMALVNTPHVIITND